MPERLLPVFRLVNAEESGEIRREYSQTCQFVWEMR